MGEESKRVVIGRFVHVLWGVADVAYMKASISERGRGELNK